MPRIARAAAGPAASNGIDAVHSPALLEMLLQMANPQHAVLVVDPFTDGESNTSPVNFKIYTDHFRGSFSSLFFYKQVVFVYLILGHV